MDMRLWPGAGGCYRWTRFEGFQNPELQMTRASRKGASPRVVSIADLRPMARRRVPKGAFDYLDGGSEGEVTLRENCRVCEDVTVRPRHAVAVAQDALRRRVIGCVLSLPFLL